MIETKTEKVNFTYSLKTEMDKGQAHKKGIWRTAISTDLPFKYFVIFLVALVLSGVLLILHEWYYDGKIKPTKYDLLAVRYCIREFRQTEGRYPNSLREVREYSDHQEGLPSLKLLFIDLKDYAQAHVAESDVLNGKGGYYYDKTTGTVRINLTQPIKHYFPFYFGSDRNQIPADW